MKIYQKIVLICKIHGYFSCVFLKLKLLDAVHIAMTAVSGLDFIVSLNFQHIVKQKTIVETGRINAQEGYRRVGIYTPKEALEHENGW
ncbi:hypothetical protein FACS1894200_10130 [Spirochaetia bacterium]|nr:hypothetical protein FACS1894200_10130 [Spirochaetia bacterium]